MLAVVVAAVVVYLVVHGGVRAIDLVGRIVIFELAVIVVVDPRIAQILVQRRAEGLFDLFGKAV